MATQAPLIVLLAPLIAGLSLGIFVYSYLVSRASLKRKSKALGKNEKKTRLAQKRSISTLTLDYAKGISSKMSLQVETSIFYTFSGKNVNFSGAKKHFDTYVLLADMDKIITFEGYMETRIRMSILGAIVGLVIGAIISIESTILFPLPSAILFNFLPKRALVSRAKQRANCAQLCLSEMLEVISLGLRSGMSFDKSFALYGQYFKNELALACLKSYQQWSLGLMSREEALRSMSNSFACDQLHRAIDSMLRGLRFGTSLSGVLKTASDQSRDTYRAHLEEKIAKAPIKMMLPTGVLILPAMLLLVIGPILLEIANGF